MSNHTYQITADSGCDLSLEKCMELDVLPYKMPFTMDGQPMVDGMTEESFKEFYRLMRAGGVAKTSQINPGEFLDFWRQQKGDDVEEHLDYEVRGIHDILKNCSEMAVEMGGVYVDGRMEAFTIGSLNPLENMAVIHIEKANPEMRGLYQYINREFLVHAFPDVALVNREDDMGLEGLRKAKMSYNPIAFARKYSVTQIDF